MPESRPRKVILQTAGALLTLCGLVFLFLAIKSIVYNEQPIRDRILFSIFGVVPLLIGALLLKKSFSSAEALLTFHVDPARILTRTQTDDEIALDGLNEKLRVAATLTKSDSTMLDQLKSEILHAPLDDEAVAKLERAGSNNSLLGNPRIQPVAFALKSPSTSQYVKGIVLSVVLWCGLLIFVPVLMFVGGLVLPWFSETDRRARRQSINPHKQLAKETRDPILYLRSFLDDDENDYNSDNLQTTEEKLIDIYSRYGPVLALGQPSEALPFLGALRIYFDNDIWQSGIIYLMSIAQVVVLEAGTARSLLWELGTARKRLNPEQLIISFAGWSNLSQLRREERYLGFKKFAEPLLECKLPPKLDPDECITFDSDWAARVLISEKQLERLKKATAGPGIVSGAMRTIVTVVLALSTYRFGHAWSNYEVELQKIRNRCIEEESADVLRMPDDETILKRMRGEAVPARDSSFEYCECLFDHARPYASRFDVAITAASYGLIDRFDEERLLNDSRRKNEKLCRQRSVRVSGFTR